MRIPGSSRSAARSTWRLSMTRRPAARRRPQRASISSSFPTFPCAYPVVWVKAREAAESARRKVSVCVMRTSGRMRAGETQPPDYRFDLAQGVPPEVAIHRMREAHNRAHASRQALELRTRLQRGICATGSFKTPGCNGGGWTAMRLQYLSGRRFSGLPQSVGRVRPQRQRRRTHESAAQSGADVEPRQHDSGLHGDEGKLVHLRHLSCPRGLVPLARALLARHAGDGPAQSRQLPPGVSLLQLRGNCGPARRQHAQGSAADSGVFASPAAASICAEPAYCAVSDVKRSCRCARGPSRVSRRARVGSARTSCSDRVASLTYT